IGPGWYGVLVSKAVSASGCGSGHTASFAYAFLVGKECSEVEIAFNPDRKFVDNAMLYDKPPITSTQSTTNYSGPTDCPYFEATGAGIGPSQKRSLMRFRLWVDPRLMINEADMFLKEQAFD